MRDILAFVFTNRTTDAGEAAQEFLLALASEKMRLQSEHVREALAFGDSDLPVMGHLLRQYILARTLLAERKSIP